MSASAGAVFVTGGARGIGWATAEEFLRRGWPVAIGDVDIDCAQARVRENGGPLIAVEVDVRDSDSVERAFASVLNRFGQIGSVINNAGIQEWTALDNLDWQVWSRVLDVNLNGVAHCLHWAARHMQPRGGSIVNVASVAAVRGIAYRAPYTAAKAAVVALTRTAAVELAEHGIRVNAVGPGYVATDLIERFTDEGRLDVDAILRMVPLGRMAQPAEIARAIHFLASDESSYITGQTLYVDGGLLACAGLPGPRFQHIVPSGKEV